MQVIECISVSKSYKGRRATINAVTNVSLEIKEGELILLKGNSGAGKTTLLNLIGGLIEPTSGDVRIDGRSITEMGNSDLSGMLLNRIGIIFQGLNLLPTYTIYENIELALVPKGLDKREVEKLIIPLFEQFGLSEKIHMFPEELSAGQQQKVAIIRTLAKQSDIILADEPTASVDEESGKEILAFFRKLCDERSVTVIIATHGSAADKIADRIITMENGSVK